MEIRPMRPIWNRVIHNSQICIYNAPDNKDLNKAFSHMPDNQWYIWWDRAGGPLDPEGWGAAQLHKLAKQCNNSIMENNLTSWLGENSSRVTAHRCRWKWLYPIWNLAHLIYPTFGGQNGLDGGGDNCPVDLLTSLGLPPGRGGGCEEL